MSIRTSRIIVEQRAYKLIDRRLLINVNRLTFVSQIFHNAIQLPTLRATLLWQHLSQTLGR
jgi:hypothetical protein